jgi:putative ABC transport system permease protein
MRALEKKLWRDLWRMKAQAIAIALVMACGIAVMIMTFGAMRSLSESRDAYYDRYRFADVFAQLKRAPLYVADQVAAIPGVANVEPRIVHYVSLHVPGLDEPAIGQLVSLPRDRSARNNDIVLRVGRLPRRGSDEVLISENLASAHSYQPGDRVSATMNGRRRTLTIVGIALSPEFIYVLGPGQLVPDDRTFGILWFDRFTLEAAYDLKGAFNNISISLMPSASEPEVIAQTDAILSRYGSTGAHGRDDQLSHAFIQQELDQLWTMARLIPPIFLAVAAFLINIIMRRLVELEHEQIGLLKAFGYSSAAVGWHYLKFTLAIGILGVVVGVGGGLALGIQMTRIYAEFYHFPVLIFRTDSWVFIVASGIALLSVLAGTWAAVLQAIRLAPAVAMVPAPPTHYRQTLIERLGIDRFMSEPTHMIFRHIERWPMRSLLTTLGIGASGAILLMSFFMFDAIDEMVDSAYFRINRQDATVQFFEPRSAKAIFEIERWPGVRRAEAARQVPARLRRAQVSQRVGIVGLSPGASLTRLLDRAGRAVVIPPQGIVLSDKLAELLNAERGDVIEVEILQGTRRKTLVAIAEVVSEYIGTSAYMEIDALNRLAGEESGVSGAQLVLDPTQQSAFFATLRRTPGVGIVTLRAPAINAFRETLAQSMLIVIFFYIGFGSVIAFGVVYNTARIALSERSRELASLRVLGFTKGEAAYILLGELAVLILLALPIAGGFGYALTWYLSSAMETKLFRIPFVLENSTFGVGAVIMLVSTAVSLLAVARRINRLDLIAVLKARE